MAAAAITKILALRDVWRWFCCGCCQLPYPVGGC